MLTASSTLWLAEYEKVSRSTKPSATFITALASAAYSTVSGDGAFE